jgi:hypothetical protein
LVTKQLIQSIKTNIERSIQGLHTKLQEFTYEQTGGFVRPNKLYSVYYTLNKDEMYLTGINDTTNSKIINKVKDKTLFAKYKDIKNLIRTSYPKMTPAKPSESDYRIGEITRYYAQIGNDTSKPIFEISKEDFNNQGNLYRYTSFQWRLSGLKEEVMRDNHKTIDGLETTYSGISKVLFPLHLWRASKNSVDDVQNKLLLMKKT